MEFPNLGEYHDNLSLEEAIRIYQEIPAERMNGIKGIGFELKDGSDYEGPFPILTGQMCIRDRLTLTEEVEIRYRTETSTDPETGETTSEEVPYEYYILNVKLTSKPISAVASELLTPEQMEMYQVYRQTMGNKPLLFGGGSPDTSGSEDLSGVQFINRCV